MRNPGGQKWMTAGECESGAYVQRRSAESDWAWWPIPAPDQWRPFAGASTSCEGWRDVAHCSVAWYTRSTWPAKGDGATWHDTIGEASGLSAPVGETLALCAAPGCDVAPHFCSRYGPMDYGTDEGLCWSLCRSAPARSPGEVNGGCTRTLECGRERSPSSSVYADPPSPTAFWAGPGQSCR
jgi:hypothetical protein